uniref:transposase n=1 Tax=Prevotella heparinolytica TaxID=28113 RepID=UPI0035A1BCCD
ITFCLTPASVDDRDKRVWPVFTKVLYGKVFVDRGYIKQELFEQLFQRGIHLLHGLKAKMKNKPMPMYDKVMLCKRRRGSYPEPAYKFIHVPHPLHTSSSATPHFVTRKPALRLP